MYNRLICFGDSFTAGEGAWLEKTKSFEDEPAKVAKFNIQYCWPTVLGELLDTFAENHGSTGDSNNAIFNNIFKYDANLSSPLQKGDLVIVMWSSSIRDKLPYLPTIFQNEGPVGLGWSLKEILEDFGQSNFIHRYYKDSKHKNFLENTINPFLNKYYKKLITSLYDPEYYNIINYNYIHMLQEYFKYKKCDYIFIDAFEPMNNFNPNSEKWDLIDKDRYWGFGENTAWDYLNNIGGDLFENTELSFNPPGQKCHPNRHGYRLIAEELHRFIVGK